jgi:hypothetical protein
MTGAILLAALLYSAPPADVAARIDKLVRSYPDFIVGRDGNALLLKDGQRFAVSDGRADKSFEEMLTQPDIDDMFYAPYPAGAAALAPAKDFDPGRVRFAPLFDAMYGNCRRGEVEPKLRRIAWLPRHGGGAVSITTVNGVDRALEAVSAALDALPQTDMTYLIPNSGTYNCRAIAGSPAPSAHGWGIAIDMNSARSDYWRWSGKAWRNRVPADVVAVFERHGFIWGGRWDHYDTMHFEYRPELLP